jgi:hypothetical protein
MVKYSTVQDLEFFDANCMFGRPCYGSVIKVGEHTWGPFIKKQQLLQEMKYYEIKEALVYHAMAKEYDPVTGNNMLLQQIKGEKALHACWTALPPYTEEIPPPEEFVKDMISRGVRAVRVFPNHYEQGGYGMWSRHKRFYLSEWSMGSLFSVFEDHRIPVFLDFDTGEPYDDRTDWDKVYEICRNHPKMPVVLVHFGWRVNRSLYALLAQCDNFYWEFSGTWLYRIIESVCKRFGSEHTLFGSYMPYNMPGVNLMMVTYADISEEEKKNIAGDNLRRLLKNVV